MDAIGKVVILILLSAGVFFFGHHRGKSAKKNRKPSSQALVAQEALDRVFENWNDDTFVRKVELDSLAELVAQAQSWPIESMTLEDLPARVVGFEKLRKETGDLLENARLSLADSKYDSVRKVLELMKKAHSLEHTRLSALLAISTGGASIAHAANAQRDLTHNALPGGRSPGGGQGAGPKILTVQVEQLPFGMHLRRGKIAVEEVFPGFPAQEKGVLPGCEIQAVAGKEVSAGTWLDTFKASKVPFELKLDCSKIGMVEGSASGVGALSTDVHRYRVMVVKRPFGMNIEVNKLPRVVEVLPGYPAEGAGIRRGFVLTQVNEKDVSVATWFDMFQNTPLPFTLTFDTDVKLHAGNEFFGNETATSLVGQPNLNKLPDSDYEDFRCDVVKVPFGMQIHAGPHDWPRVLRTTPGMPAQTEGIRSGDVLIEVNGIAVDSKRWFSTFQQAATPFGLKFRRPRHAANT